MSNELPKNDVDYPMYMDSADMHLATKSHIKSMLELEDRLIEQVRTNGVTRCGHTSEASIRKAFSKFH